MGSAGGGTSKPETETNFEKAESKLLDGALKKQPRVSKGRWLQSRRKLICSRKPPKFRTINSQEKETQNNTNIDLKMGQVKVCGTLNAHHQFMPPHPAHICCTKARYFSPSKTFPGKIMTAWGAPGQLQGDRDIHRL